MRFSSSLALVCKSGREAFNATPLSRTNIAGKDIRNAPLTSHIIAGTVSISLITAKFRMKVYATSYRQSNMFWREEVRYYAVKVVECLTYEASVFYLKQEQVKWDGTLSISLPFHSLSCFK